MKFSRTLLGAAAALLSIAAVPAQALTSDGTACTFGDLTGVTVTACSGFWAGNLIDGAGPDTEVAAALLLMGVVSDGSYSEKIAGTGGSMTINFITPLSGDTIVGLHFGGGAFPGGGNDQGTAFYRFNAGTSLDTFGLTLTSSSNAAIYQTSEVPVPGVPEPETYALMLAGLGVLGFVARRRKSV